MNTRSIRLSGLLLALCALWYAPWLVMSLNRNALWLALPFIAANLLIAANALLTVVNNWSRSIPKEQLISVGSEPDVAVIVPTCGEPPAMVERTLRSILTQNWPHDRLRLVLSDDAHQPQLATLTASLRREYPETALVYHEPPARNAPERKGEAKAGALNSALEMILQRWPGVRYLETRDADDLVGDSNFLRHALGQLTASRRIAYVQTIKEAQVSEGDPFGANEPFFYRGCMLARNAANAVFPCGSGLVWRLDALLDIGGFPVWNLVEDLHSGVLALQSGWRGVYLPIIGALAQHAPEDLPNVYKQRGVWALDTLRLLFWGDWRGLNLRQRLHFAEMGLFYLQGFSLLTILGVLIASFALRLTPLTTDFFTYALHFWPFVISLELFLAAMNGGRSWEDLLRARQMWMGLAPVYVRATLLALFYGPRRKPAYTVTRKVTRVGWHWRAALPQMVLLVALSLSVAYALATTSVLTQFDLGSAYWAAYFGMFLGGFIAKSWYGVNALASMRMNLRALLRRPARESVGESRSAS
jgi:cellulose synthase (UDP-forming)